MKRGTLERESFCSSCRRRQSRALRHAFLGERAAAKIPDVPEDTPLRKIEKMAVVGAGPWRGITMNFLSAGIPVTLLEMKQEALDRGLATIRRNYEASARKGRLSAQQLEERMALLEPTSPTTI